MPRVNGNSPGASPAASAGTSAGPYTRGTGSPQDVSGRRSLPLIEDSSQRDVAVLPRRVGVALGLENRQRRAQPRARRSEEHTSELQSPCNLVCRLLLEKKKKN